MSLLILFGGATTEAPEPIDGNVENAAFVEFKDNRAIVEFKDNRAYVKFKDNRAVTKE
jgi:uncharacterized protein (DUF1330 family)